MSDVLDRIRFVLQQRLESTRAAAQEHERVRAALEALEHAIKPLEKVTRRAAGAASQRARGSARGGGAAGGGGGAARGCDGRWGGVGERRFGCRSRSCGSVARYVRRTRRGPAKAELGKPWW